MTCNEELSKHKLPCYACGLNVGVMAKAIGFEPWGLGFKPHGIQSLAMLAKLG